MNALGTFGLCDVEVTKRFDCFRGTSKQNVARTFGVHGVNALARKS